MAEIQRKLQRLDFPFNSKEALNYIVHCCMSGKANTQQAIPGLEVVSDNFSNEVCQEFIFFNTMKKGQNRHKLNPIQELKLLELICNCISEAPDKVKQEVFHVIFSAEQNDEKTQFKLLTKLISMALNMSRSSVLTCAAVWMSDIGNQNMLVCDVIEKFVQDYCSLFPETSKAFQNLPVVSPLFTSSFITTVTFIYNFKHLKKFPSLSLLQSISEWISKHNCLCADLVPVHKKSQKILSPINGLVRWTVIGHVASSMFATKDFDNATQDKLAQTIKVLSQLHISLLLSLQSSTKGSHSGLVAADVKLILSDLVETFRHKDTDREQMFYTILVAVERLAQLVQVAFASTCLSLTDSDRRDMQKISEGLPPNRLLQIVLKNTEKTATE